MQKDMRDRLAQLIGEKGVDFEYYGSECVADHLIAHGVILPPCKVGDVVWLVDQDIAGEWFISEEKVVDVSAKGFYTSEFLDGTGAKVLWSYEEIGDIAFLTREEAEAAIKNRDT